MQTATRGADNPKERFSENHTGDREPDLLRSRSVERLGGAILTAASGLSLTLAAAFTGWQEGSAIVAIALLVLTIAYGVNHSRRNGADGSLA